MLMRSILNYGCLFAALGWVHFASAASFDCAKAKSLVEKTICSDGELSKLDEKLSEVYKISLKEHPVQNYVRARQREWIRDNNTCDKAKLAVCLRNNYEKRILTLTDISTAKVYSNTEKFEYSNGDAVAEIREKNGKFFINVWGGFRVHRQASQAAGKEVYLGCDFEGSFISKNGGKAMSLSGDTFEFKISGNKLTYTDLRCEGFGSLPDELVLTGK